MNYNPVWNAKKPVVPVDRDGNWLHYPNHWQMREGGGCQPVEPFWATMRLAGMNSGRSAKYLTLENVETKVQYPMFISDLVKAIQNGAVEVKGSDGEGYLSGNWTGSKRGANYGIKAV